MKGRKSSNLPKSAKKLPKSARITAQGMGRDSYFGKIANFASNVI
jgi:hypothetical protein